jgi:hypothetical protein
VFVCPLGASAALPCDEGSYSSATNLSSAGLCTLTEPGFFSPLGSREPTECPIGAYSVQAGSPRCTECPAGTTTVSTRTIGLEGCVCKADQYDRNATATGTDCIDCPYSSTDCKPVGAGVTLESLPLAPGYWRAHNGSERLRQCYTKRFCTGGRDCAGGRFCDGYCARNHSGPYCMLCMDGFVKSTDGSCTVCDGSVVLSFAFPVTVVLCFIVLAVWSARKGRAPVDVAYLDAFAEAAFQVAMILRLLHLSLLLNLLHYYIHLLTTSSHSRWRRQKPQTTGMGPMNCCHPTVHLRTLCLPVASR